MSKKLYSIHCRPPGTLNWANFHNGMILIYINSNTTIMHTGNPSASIDSLQSTATSLLQDHLLLLQLKGTKKIAQLIALIAAVLLMVFLGFFILVLISAIGCYYLINLLGSTYAGLGIITGFYIILLILLIVLRKKYLQTAVASTIIKILFDATDKTKANEK